MRNRFRSPNSADPNIPNLRWVEYMGKLMDSKFKIPGTNYRFGLDPILGFIPVVGDAASFAISGGLIVYMLRYGVSKKVVIKMVINAALDATIGSIPVIGWIFDFFYKANERNIRLLKEHYEEGRHTGSSKGLIAGVVIALVLLLALFIWGLIELAQWIFSLF